MFRKSPIIPALALGAVLVAFAGPPAVAAAAPACFRLSQIQSTRPDGDKVVYAKTNGGEVYRLDMKFQCAALRNDNGLVLEPFGGTDVICHALDLDVSARNLSGPPTPCALDSITKLTPAEIAAIPSRAKP